MVRRQLSGNALDTSTSVTLRNSRVAGRFPPHSPPERHAPQPERWWDGRKFSPSIAMRPHDARSPTDTTRPRTASPMFPAAAIRQRRKRPPPAWLDTINRSPTKNRLHLLPSPSTPDRGLEEPQSGSPNAENAFIAGGAPLPPALRGPGSTGTISSRPASRETVVTEFDPSGIDVGFPFEEALSSEELAERAASAAEVEAEPAADAEPEREQAEGEPEPEPESEPEPEPEPEATGLQGGLAARRLAIKESRAKAAEAAAAAAAADAEVAAAAEADMASGPEPEAEGEEAEREVADGEEGVGEHDGNESVDQMSQGRPRTPNSLKGDLPRPALSPSKHEGFSAFNSDSSWLFDASNPRARKQCNFSAERHQRQLQRVSSRGLPGPLQGRSGALLVRSMSRSKTHDAEKLMRSALAATDEEMMEEALLHLVDAIWLDGSNRRARIAYDRGRTICLVWQANRLMHQTQTVAAARYDETGTRDDFEALTHELERVRGVYAQALQIDGKNPAASRGLERVSVRIGKMHTVLMTNSFPGAASMSLWSFAALSATA